MSIAQILWSSAMSAVEREIIERIRQMDEQSKQRVLDFIVHQKSGLSESTPDNALKRMREQLKREGRLMSMEEFQAFIDEEKAERR
jgi:acetyl-CoA carboxylase alpha subunit